MKLTCEVDSFGNFELRYSGSLSDWAGNAERLVRSFVAEAEGRRPLPAASAPPMPVKAASVSTTDSHRLAEALEKFVTACEVVQEPRTDFVALVHELGCLPSVIPMLNALGGLQSAIYRLVSTKARHEDPGWPDKVEQIAGFMLQVSHQGFPELGEAFDYAQKWRKEIN